MKKQSMTMTSSMTSAACATENGRARASFSRAAWMVLILDTIFMVSVFFVLGSVLPSLVHTINSTLLGMIAAVVILASLLILVGILLPLIRLTVFAPFSRSKER